MRIFAFFLWNGATFSSTKYVQKGPVVGSELCPSSQVAIAENDNRPSLKLNLKGGGSVSFSFIVRCLLHVFPKSMTDFPPARHESPETIQQASSFAFKLFHGLLPHESRLAEVLPSNEPVYRFKCPGDPVAYMLHCLISCLKTAQVCQRLINLVQQHIQIITPPQILGLKVDDNSSLTLVIINTLLFLWNRRSVGKNS